jgi:short-subunit dehydrogenase
MDLAQKVIMITGASSGLGKALAMKLCNEKPNLVLLSRSAEKLQDVVTKIKEAGTTVSSFSCNITDFEQVQHTVEYVIEAYGHIDILINNAGILYEAPFVDYPLNTILEMFDVNCIGAICMTQTVLPYMKKNNAGQIVNVISTAGMEPKVNATVYNATKYALEGFTQSLKLELAGSGIKIIGCYPGGMEANLFTTSELGDPESPAWKEKAHVADLIVQILKSPETITVDHVEVRRFSS